MGQKGNKNFLCLGDEPVLLRTLRTFSASTLIDNLIVVVAADEVNMTEELLQKADGLKPFMVTAGGAERQYSIANGLELLPNDTDIVLVHDAARPLVSVKVIDDVIHAAKEHGGAIAAVPAKNTVKRADEENFVTDTPPRSELWEVQTPQGFRREVILAAYEKAARENFLGTDDASLAERLPAKVKCVMSDYKNIKITTPEDFVIARAFLEQTEK